MMSKVRGRWRLPILFSSFRSCESYFPTIAGLVGDVANAVFGVFQAAVGKFMAFPRTRQPPKL